MNKVDAEVKHLSDKQQRYVDNTMRNLMEEISLLEAWFKLEYPEYRMTVEANLDKIRLTFSLTFRISTGREVSSNMGFFESKPVIHERQFMDGGFMRQFLKAINTELRSQIVRSMNEYYEKEKAMGRIK